MRSGVPQASDTPALKETGTVKGTIKKRLARLLVSSIVAIAAAIVPFLIREGLAHAFGFILPPFLLSYGAVLLVALGLGFWAGLLTALAAIILANIWTLPFAAHWHTQYWSDAVAHFVFVFICILVCALSETYRSTLRRTVAFEGERELRASEDRFHSVLRDSRDVLYRFNLQSGRYEFVSPSAQAVIGYTEADFNSMGEEMAVALVHPDERAALLEQFKRAEPGSQIEVEYRMRGKDGNYRWVSNLLSVHCGTGGTPLYREGTLRDITEKKTAEQALLRSATLASAGRMSAAIAHEINNPLAAVTNLLFLALHHPDLPKPVREYIATADAELNRIALITRRALGFYREANAPALVSIDSILDSAIDLFKHQIHARQAHIVKDGDTGLELTAVGGELRQIFSNLISNSLDAISEQGQIHIRARRGRSASNGNAYIRVIVADNGRGISDEIRSQIFEPFFTTKGTVGTGLGLWVSGQLVEKNGGTIRSRSSTSPERHGTVFLVELPA